jgi:hypothetical protein
MNHRVIDPGETSILEERQKTDDPGETSILKVLEEKKKHRPPHWAPNF